MQNPKIQVDMSVNAVNFNKQIHQAGEQIHGLSGISEGLKGTLATAFGGATIAIAIEKMIDFADTTIKGADALNVSVKQFEALRLMSEETGTSMDAVSSAINKIGLSADEALEGNAKKMAALHFFKLNKDDLKTMSDFQLLQKAFENTKGQTRETVEAGLRQIGIKRPGELMPAREQLGGFKEFTNEKDAAGLLPNPEDVKHIQELKLQFDSLSNSIKSEAIPLFAWFIPIVFGVIDAFRKLGVYMGTIVISSISRYTDTMKGIWDTAKSLYTHTDNAISGKETFTQAYKGYNEDASNISDDLYDKFKADNSEDSNLIESELKKIDDEAEARKKASELADSIFKKDQEEKEKGTANREVPTEKETKFGSNQYLKVGGLMGVDLNTRLSQITIQGVEYARQSAQSLKNIETAVSKPKPIVPIEGSHVPPGR